MLTQKKFDILCGYVRMRLKKEKEFRLTRKELERMFGLVIPYYHDFELMVTQQSIGFGFKRPSWRSRDREPTQGLVFFRFE